MSYEARETAAREEIAALRRAALVSQQYAMMSLPVWDWLRTYSSDLYR